MQADISTTRQFGGTGLGLYISKQLADLLGGEIGVASVAGQGSRFWLDLPVGKPTRAIEMLTDEGDFASYHRPDFEVSQIEVPLLDGRVLLAEDGIDNQRLLAAYLRQAGLEVDIVGNGQLAVDKAMGHDYALVLMDIQMPLLDGVAATTQLRAAGYTQPIVALTANVMQADVAHYRACGCNDVLAKPVDRGRFYSVLQRFVRGAAPPDIAVDDGYARELAALTAEFCAGLPATLEAIGEAAARADGAALKALIHTLKGTAGSYGFAQISALAAEVEAGLGAADRGGTAAQCARLIEHARHVIGRPVQP